MGQCLLQQIPVWLRSAKLNIFFDAGHKPKRVLTTIAKSFTVVLK